MPRSGRRLVTLVVAFSGLLSGVIASHPGVKAVPTCCGTPHLLQSDGFLWIEGEHATRHNFNQHNWYSRADVRLELLSPGTPVNPPSMGDWLAHYSDGSEPAQAAYDFTIANPGRYEFWVRCSAYRVRQWYELDGGPRIAIDLESDPRERVNLTAPKLDIRFVAWFQLGSHVLEAGRHNVTLGLQSHPAWEAAGAQEQTHGGIDAIVVTRVPWAPAGTLRTIGAPMPDPGPDDWFVLRPDDDPHSADSIIDMSSLLDRPAGMHGPVRSEGDSLVFADGTPIRFWGIGANMAATEKLQEQQARFLAKHGVNLVRQHPVQAVVGLLRRDPATGERSFAGAGLDRLDRWFATLKAHGIYMWFAPFYPHVITEEDDYPPELYAELPDRGVGKSTAGFVALEPRLQTAELEWLQALLAHVNPYTGLSYAADPALAILEIHNEDSVFWHYPLNVLAEGKDAPLHTARLQRAWMEWLRGQYSSDAELLAAWGPVGRGSRAGDSLSNERMPIYGAWEMEGDGPALNEAETSRMGDFIRFLAETQREYYERRGAALRRMGFEGLRVTTAWRAGGPAARAANLWTDDALDAIDRHAYFGGGAGGWRITEGTLDNRSHIDSPGEGMLEAGFEQVEGKPFLISEWSQSPPNQWKAESAPLVAFYGMGLHGWDVALHFCGSLPRMGSGWPRLSSFVSETPHYLGQYPALAFAVHRSHYEQGEIVAARRLSTADAFLGFDALTRAYPGGGYASDPPGSSLLTPPPLFAMGRVTLSVTEEAAASRKAEWDDLWDRDRGVVNSTTGQLVWDYGRRTVVARGEKTQGVVGFAGGYSFDLPGVAVEVGAATPFVSLLFTPLDDEPLAESRHVLITALARDRQTGAAYGPGGSELTDTGGPPLELEPVQATILFKGDPVVSASVVDQFGVPTNRPVERSGNRIRIDGRYATYYYEVRRRPATPSSTVSPGPQETPTSTTDSPSPSIRLFLPYTDLGR